MLEGRLCDRQYIIQKWIFAWFENSSYCLSNQCPVQLLSRFFIAYFEDICKIISNDISILRHIFQLNLRSLNSRKILRHIKLILIFQTFNRYWNEKVNKYIFIYIFSIYLIYPLRREGGWLTLHSPLDFAVSWRILAICRWQIHLFGCRLVVDHRFHQGLCSHHCCTNRYCRHHMVYL